MVIKEKSNGKWVITLSFFLAYLLAIVPFPEWAMDYRPEWVSMVLVYWVMALPYRVGIGSAWFIGLILDIGLICWIDRVLILDWIGILFSVL